MNTRIKQIIEHEGLTDAEFADRAGIKRATLSHCLNGRNDVSKDIILKIHNAYPQVSVNWLMFGEGEPYIKEKLKTPTSLFDEKIIARLLKSWFFIRIIRLKHFPPTFSNR